MADEAQLLYLEPDDEITTVVRRLRETDARRVVLVASGRTKATTSAVALRLLAQVAAEEGREVVLVADPAARSLAAEAGIAAFASVAEANVEGAVALAPPPAPRAPIHVVRGEAAPATVDQPAAGLAPVAAPATGLEETQAVPIQRPSPARRQPPSRRTAPAGRRPSVSRAALVAVLALLIVAGVAIGTVAPAASVTIRPQAVAIGPFPYDVRPAVQPADLEPLESTKSGEATGHRTHRVAASGTVTLLNWNTVAVDVSSGTELSAGKTRFQTTDGVTVPAGQFTPDGRVQAGEANAGVVAEETGTAGNVAAGAIDTVEDRLVMIFLRGFPNNKERLVVNAEAIAGGLVEELTVIRGPDVNRVKAAVADDLDQQLEEALAEDPDRLYPVTEAIEPVIDVPDDLVGTEGQDTFELSGTLTPVLPFVLRADAEAAARQALLDDPTAVPGGMTLDQAATEVQLGGPTMDGEAIVVPATVTSSAAPQVNEGTLRGQIRGHTPAEAEAMLRSIGPTTVELWPFWVDRVPGLEWRISFDVRPLEPAA